MNVTKLQLRAEGLFFCGLLPCLMAAAGIWINTLMGAH